MSDLLWTGGFERGPASIRGNCAAGAPEWCDAQIVRPEQVRVVTDAEGVPPPAGKGCARIEVRFGDVYRDYSDARALLTGNPALWASEGDERWLRWQMLYPAGWVGSYPKWDELTRWPARFADGGSSIVWHHEPFQGGVEQGSAPTYVGANASEVYLVHAAPAIVAAYAKGVFNPEIPYLRWATPLKRGQWMDFLMHIRFSPKGDGLMEAWCDGVRFASYSGPTQYPGTRSYLQAGLYRSGRIGDPSLRWPAGTAKAGQQVYPDQTPGVVYLDGFALGKTRESVGYPLAAQAPVQPPAPSAPTPTAPAVNPTLAKQGLALLIAELAFLDTVDALIQKHRDDIKALLDQGPW